MRYAGGMSSLRELLGDKRFGLVMSAGFFGFYGHAGFLRGVLEAGLSPSAYAGTSAGGLVAALAAAGLSTSEIEGLLLRQTRRSFWDPDPLGAMVDALRGGHGPSGLLKGERFRGLLERALPVKTFAECRTPLLLVAANLTAGRSEVFTEGPLAPCIHATCAYPGLFRAVQIGGALFWDGGVVDKAPALALADSGLGRSLEAILVHYLPSRESGPNGLLAYPKGLATGMASLRREHFRLQLSLLQARGVPVYVVTSELPPVSPTTMDTGAQALRAAREAAERALSAPPALFA